MFAANNAHQHGGQLRAASERYGITLEDWLDLSTGISPHPYPLPAVPITCWQRLPESGDGLEAAASTYYGSSNLLAVSGSQEAIQRLPQLRKPGGKVGILSPAYHSHQQAWQNAGHNVVSYAYSEIENVLDTLDVLLVVNPTNPSADLFPLTQLRQWQQRLTRRGAWLIVDEAFIDSRPEHSLIQPQALPGLIVLRSVGKFFGLAGIRLGFVWAETALLQRLLKRQDDWSVSHPARWAGTLALADTNWQQQQRITLCQMGERLHALLKQAYGQRATMRSDPLFTYCALSDAAQEYTRLAQQGILVRQFTHPCALRFGLPADEPAWQRLQGAL